MFIFPAFHWWRTVFWLIPAISVYTVLLGAVSLISSLFDRTGNIAHSCARLWSRFILATTGVKVRVQGLNRVPRNGSYVFVSNHQSIYDIPILFSTLPYQLRIIAKSSLGRFPVLGWHLRYTGHLLINREKVGVGTLGQVAKLMKRGHSLVAFPEGTRSRDGQIDRFKPGLFLMAVDADVPVVPVSVSGSRHVMLKGRLMTCPGVVDVVIHDPISTKGMTRKNVRALADLSRDVIQARVSVG